MTQTKKCCKCCQEFEAEVTVVASVGRRRVVVQRVCKECFETRHKWVKKRAHARERQARALAEPRSRGLAPEAAEARKYGQSRPAIARALGITERAVVMAEESLLLKLRTNPNLRAAYAEYNDDGAPLLVQLVRELRPVQREITLLDLQQELFEWWAVLTQARRAGLTDADGLGEATAAVAKSHALLAAKIASGKL